MVNFLQRTWENGKVIAMMVGAIILFLAVAFALAGGILFVASALWGIYPALGVIGGIVLFVAVTGFVATMIEVLGDRT